MKNMAMSPKEREELTTDSKSFFASTSLKHLTGLHGWNAGNIHTVMATTGAGKSTYVRTIIVDFLRHNPDKKILVWLSEVSIKDFKTELARLPENIKLENIIAHSEVDSPFNSTIQELRESTITEDVDLFIYDNLTTSKVYSNDYKTQVSVLHQLKQNCALTEIPFVFIIHTKKGIDKYYHRLLTSDHVQGCSDIAQISEFFFVIQNVYVGARIMTHLVLEKYRNKHPRNNIFRLEYNQGLGIYDTEDPKSFSDLNDCWKMRNRLEV